MYYLYFFFILYVKSVKIHALCSLQILSTYIYGFEFLCHEYIYL